NVHNVDQHDVDVHDADEHDVDQHDATELFSDGEQLTVQGVTRTDMLEEDRSLPHDDEPVKPHSYDDEHVETGSARGTTIGESPMVMARVLDAGQYTDATSHDSPPITPHVGTGSAQGITIGASPMATAPVPDTQPQTDVTDNNRPPTPFRTGASLPTDQ